MARALIAVGLTLVAVGLLWHVGGKYLPFGRLPGDIRIEGEGFRLYVPLATCILLSVVATVVLWLSGHIRR